MERFAEISCLLSWLVILFGLMACANAQPAAFYKPEPVRIDAFGPRCGMFKRHQSVMDTNGLGCAGGYHPTLANNSIDGDTVALKRRRRMAGGHQVRPEEAPHFVQMVWLSFKEDEYRTCGGTIIHKNLILTAAHCLKTLKENGGTIGVIAGANEINQVGTRLSHDGTLVRVSKHLRLRGRVPGLHFTNDIAILRLAEDLVYSERVQPACLRLESAPRNDALCFNAGTGYINRNQEFPNHMNGLPMEMEPNSHNKPLMENFWWLPLVEATICNGDSGSGLMCYDSCDNSGAVRSYLAGILSSGDRQSHVCEERKQTGGYVNLHGVRNALLSMIDEILK